jgi:replicative DNA helicase Mcm
MFEEVYQELEDIITTEYNDELDDAIINGRAYFTINFTDLSRENRKTIIKNYGKIQTGDFPFDTFMAALFNSRANTIGFGGDFKRVNLFFSNVPTNKTIRAITSEETGQLIGINGIVISISPPHSIPVLSVHKCKCGFLINEPTVNGEIIKPTKCPSCDRRNAFILNRSLSKWDDYQEVMIQENPELVDSGVVPRTIKLVLIGKALVDICKPGDNANVTCTLIPDQIKVRGGTPIFSWSLHVNDIDVLSKDSFNTALHQDDIEVLQNYATNPNILRLLSNSVFPSIHGHDNVKMGLILAMFGGVDKKKIDVNQRGNIHVIMIGDPGVAKSRMLRAVRNASPKAFYSSGTGASGVGLTASVINDKLGWRLEAGALVLADMGIACIDEIEKIGSEDLEHLLEGMSDQTISINKANIHTSLRARTSVLAAANPKYGKYNENEYLTDNIDLSPVLLSRFDIMFIMKDTPDEENDIAIANKVFGLGDEELEVMEHEWLKKYILFAKSLKPELTQEAMTRILEYYIPLRKKSTEVQDSPVQITTRQLEGLRRLTEASARARLDSIATVEDANLAISLMTRSLEKAGYDPKTGMTDIGGLATGKPVSLKHRVDIVHSILKSSKDPMHISAILDRAVEYGISEKDTKSVLRALVNDGFIYVPTANQYHSVG